MIASCVCVLLLFTWTDWLYQSMRDKPWTMGALMLRVKFASSSLIYLLEHTYGSWVLQFYIIPGSIKAATVSTIVRKPTILLVLKNLHTHTHHIRIKSLQYNIIFNVKKNNIIWFTFINPQTPPPPTVPIIVYHCYSYIIWAFGKL